MTGVLLSALLLAACQQAVPVKEDPPDASEPAVISAQEGAEILEKQLGTVDAATGNVMSYGYEGIVTVDDVPYYNYRVSWLVDGDHMSYLANYLVSTDGNLVQEYLPKSPEA